MDWQDQGILLSARRFGEGSAIVEVFTAEHGRHAGIVRGGGSRKMAPVLQPGTQVNVEWRARLEDHLGTYTIEPKFSRSAQLMQDRGRLSGFSAWVSLVSVLLPERDSHPQLYDESLDLLETLTGDQNWYYAYTFWELSLLRDLGFGLDLSRCAATGKTSKLCFVSPKSGRAVSASGAIGWEDKLLKLPEYITVKDQIDPTAEQFRQALVLCGYFLENWAMHQQGKPKMPESRVQLLARVTKLVLR